MVIPRGKKLLIMHESGKDLFDWYNDNNTNSPNQIQRVPFLLDNDVSINLSSQFSQFLGDTGVVPQISALFGSIKAVRNFFGSGQFKQMGLQTWQKTDPVSLSLEVTLNMRTDAKKDVYDPAKLLMKLPLPSTASSGTGGLIPPGPTIWSTIQDTFSNSKKNRDSSSNDLFDRGYIFSIQIGKTIWLDQVIFKKVVPVFSLETDTNDYPISCKLSLDIDSIFTATTEMVDEFDSNIGFNIKNNKGRGI